MAKKLRTDWILFAVATLLALFGVIMVYSASAMISLRESNEATQYNYVLKQFGFTIIGLILMYLVSKVHYRWLQKEWVVFGLLAATIVLLIVVFAFPPINGARRWIKFPGFTFQPSEMAKLSLSLFLAYFLTKREKYIGDLKIGVLPCVAVMATLTLLIFFEPDLGTVIILAAIFTTVYFAAGARWLHIGAAIGVLFAFGAAGLLFFSYRMERLKAYWDPWQEKAGTGYQVVQSLMAVGSGGIFGEGFAKGQQKMFYLPFPHSDFIFAVVAEELGLVGALSVLMAFGILLWRGARAALYAPDRFGKLLGIGIITGIIVQAFFNISVVVGLVPTKGIPLPFISYGGTSIVFTLFSIGILLNISQHAGFVELEEGAAAVHRRKNRSRRLSVERLREA